MGRHNHENSVAVPGFSKRVVLSGDDTFQTNAPASSQLYMYTAASASDVWNDTGTLYAFRANGSDNDYFDLQPGEVIAGTFVAVPKDIARGKSSVDGHELTRAVDFPSYPPPSGGPSLPRTDRSGCSTSGATRRIHRRSRGNDVFDFIRIEDMAYDKRPHMSNVVYIADSGRAESGAAAPLTKSTNGRIYKLVLDPARHG